MKKDIRLVVLEHLSDELNVHVLNIDFLWEDLRQLERTKQMPHTDDGPEGFYSEPLPPHLVSPANGY